MDIMAKGANLIDAGCATIALAEAGAGVELVVGAGACRIDGAQGRRVRTEVS